MELMNQPLTGQLGSRLIELLKVPDYHTLNIVVAFAKNRGVLRIKDSLESFRERGGIVNVYVGVDLGGTSYEALTALLLHTDSLNVVHSEKSQTFHSKIYQFLGKEEGLVVVGSHNLTAGGLWTNFESSVIIPVKKTGGKSGRLLQGMDDYIEKLSSLEESHMEIVVQEDIDKLLHNGYIFREVAEQVRRAKSATKNEGQERLFGNGASAHLPGVNLPKEGKKKAKKKAQKKSSLASEAPANSSHCIPSDADQTIWFETKSMTGGSRNILDLSKKSLIERGDPRGTPFDLDDSRFMRGGVEFFGLNPTDTDQKKNITLNFEGIDYTGNEILYPDGESANGTWRLQIKGKSSSEQRITEAFRAKDEGYLLVNKIITFTKVQDDYYYLSVFKDSELETFKAASHLLARNGSTRNAKQLGLIFKPLDTP